MPEKNSSDPLRKCVQCGEPFVPTIRSARCPVCRSLTDEQWQALRQETPNAKHLRLLRETGRHY